MATRIISAHLTKKNTVKVKFKTQEVPKGQVEESFDAELSKTSNQEAHRDLVHALDALTPHLLFRSELIDKSVAIPTSVKDEDYFLKWFWEDDARMKNFKITGIKTFGKHAVEGIYIFGHKETEFGDVVGLKSPLISLDHSEENNYPLHRILSSQMETLLDEIDKYLFEGKNVNTITNQLSMFPPKEKVA